MSTIFILQVRRHRVFFFFERERVVTQGHQTYISKWVKIGQKNVYIEQQIYSVNVCDQ